MATGLLLHHCSHHPDHHVSEQHRPAPCSHAAAHLLHALPHHLQHHRSKAAAVCRCSTSAEQPGSIRCGLHAQQHPACSSGHLPQQPHQQRGGGNGCAATPSGGSNWALAASSSSSPAAALGWNSAAAFHSSYALGEQIGSGAFGEVRKAVHTQTGASYAVKLLPKVSQGKSAVDAIQREVCTWQEAQASKFVAKLEGLFEDEDQVYIVQELCMGGSLQEYLAAKGPCREHEAAAIMQGVLDLLVECHRRHIYYGDLKPANIMLLSSDTQQPGGLLQVRAIDFGLSRSARGRALTGSSGGTPAYAAPEHAALRYGVGADVWSAGVVLYQMLTGRLPFWPRKTLEQVSRLPLYEIISGTRTHEVEFPRSLWAGISPAARELVSRMLDRNPATRITAKEALCHPWMCATLGFVPTPSSDTAAGAAEGLLQGGPSSVRPTLQQVSPGKGSNVSPGPLSPKRPSPSRSVLSGELPTSLLLAADMHKTSMPLLVPAAE